jgi:hypothetical protein
MNIENSFPPIKLILKSSESRGGQRGELHGKGGNAVQMQNNFLSLLAEKAYFFQKERQQWKRQPK